MPVRASKRSGIAAMTRREIRRRGSADKAAAAPAAVGRPPAAAGAGAALTDAEQQWFTDATPLIERFGAARVALLTADSPEEIEDVAREFASIATSVARLRAPSRRIRKCRAALRDAAVAASIGARSLAKSESAWGRLRQLIDTLEEA